MLIASIPLLANGIWRNFLLLSDIDNIDNSECFGVKFVKIYPEMTSQYFWDKIWVFSTFPKTFDR